MSHIPHGIIKWCQAADVSRPFLYKLWRQGEGPKSVKVGRRRFITESPVDWLQRIKSSQGDAA